MKQLSREFGVGADTIRNSRVQVRADAGGGSARGAVTDVPPSRREREELQELLRKLRQVQKERDILAKATAWFAGKNERTSTTSSNS